jgi:hypothetical protein
MSSLNTQTKGDMAELRVAAELKRHGHTVLMPFTESEQYDLVADTGDEFVKVQVKYASMKDGRVKVSCYGPNSSKSGNNTTIYTEDDIDGIAAYCDELSRCFWIPFDDLNKFSFTLSADGEHKFNTYGLSNL